MIYHKVVTQGYGQRPNLIVTRGFGFGMIVGEVLAVSSEVTPSLDFNSPVTMSRPFRSMVQSLWTLRSPVVTGKALRSLIQATLEKISDVGRWTNN